MNIREGIKVFVVYPYVYLFVFPFWLTVCFLHTDSSLVGPTSVSFLLLPTSHSPSFLTFSYALYSSPPFPASLCLPPLSRSPLRVPFRNSHFITCSSAAVSPDLHYVPHHFLLLLIPFLGSFLVPELTIFPEALFWLSTLLFVFLFLFFFSSSCFSSPFAPLPSFSPHSSSLSSSFSS